MRTPPSFTSHQSVPSLRYTLVSTGHCSDVRTFGKTEDAAGSGTGDYSAAAASFQPSTGTAAERFDLLCALPLLLSTVALPIERRKE